MAKALRTDLINHREWAQFIEAADRRLDARHLEKCSTCNTTYTVFLNVMDNNEESVNLLREVLPRECPEHEPAYYIINEDKAGIRVAKFAGGFPPA